jgi:hypothetical protein
MFRFLRFRFRNTARRMARSGGALFGYLARVGVAAGAVVPLLHLRKAGLCRTFLLEEIPPSQRNISGYKEWIRPDPDSEGGQK